MIQIVCARCGKTTPTMYYNNAQARGKWMCEICLIGTTAAGPIATRKGKKA